MSWVHRCMIVTDVYASTARGLSAGLAGVAGDGMWTVPLSATGALPATHYISTGMIESQFADLLPLWEVDDIGTLVQLSPGQPDTIVAASNAAGNPITLDQVNALLAACDITEQPPFTAMSRLGLQMIQGTT